jgi:hypothetical protein
MKNAVKDMLKEKGDNLLQNKAPLSEWLKNGLVPKSEIAPVKMVTGNEKVFGKVMDASGNIYQWIGFSWVHDGYADLFREAGLLNSNDNKQVPVIY